MKSSFGEILKITISGGSHEPSVNVSITGFPRDFKPDMGRLQSFLDRRAPGRGSLTSSRREPDVPVLKFDSEPSGEAVEMTLDIPTNDADTEIGCKEMGNPINIATGETNTEIGCATGEMPTGDINRRCEEIGNVTAAPEPPAPRRMDFEIANSDFRSEDYDKFKYIPRPGHADYTAGLRYGDSVNMSGGGPFSGRMTVGLCVAGGLALQILAKKGISVSAELVSAGGSADIETAVAAALDAGDSIGGIVQCIAEGIPAGIGEAMYGGLESRLAKILFGIPAVKGVDFGAGFNAADMKGSENNDAFYCCNTASGIGTVNNICAPVSSRRPILKTRTNNCGGILGGITTGMPVVCRVAFKPTPSIAILQESVDLRTGESVHISVEGRHDPCVAIRAVPVVEAAVALGLLDAIFVTENALFGGTERRAGCGAECEVNRDSNCCANHIANYNSSRDAIECNATHANTFDGFAAVDENADNETLEVLSLVSLNQLKANIDSISENIPALREGIDSIDAEILMLFEARMKLAGKIGELKKSSGLPIRNRRREDEIIEKIACDTEGDLVPYAERFFKELFALSRDYQQGRDYQQAGAGGVGDSSSELSDRQSRPDADDIKDTDYELSGGQSQTSALSGSEQAFPGNLKIDNGTYCDEQSQADATCEYGLIGHPLGHSFSCRVHDAFGAYDFRLFDLPLKEMKTFVSSRNFRGLTVTRPYKQDVIPLCDRLTDRAKAIGAVNTLYYEDSFLIGHNTDYDGFLYTADRSGIDFAKKNVLILGTGGTSRTVSFAVRDRGAAQVYFASRQRRTGAAFNSDFADRSAQAAAATEANEAIKCGFSGEFGCTAKSGAAAETGVMSEAEMSEHSRASAIYSSGHCAASMYDDEYRDVINYGDGHGVTPNYDVAHRDVYSYEELRLIANEIDIIVNTTPVGMFPNNLEQLISLKDFPACQGVIDVIYNPLRTALLMEAEELGLKQANGMPMIVAQAAAAADCFVGSGCACCENSCEDNSDSAYPAHCSDRCRGGDDDSVSCCNDNPDIARDSDRCGCSYDDNGSCCNDSPGIARDSDRCGCSGSFMTRVEDVLEKLEQETKNIVLIGMPGCGKTTVGRLLAHVTGRSFVDLDYEIEQNSGRSISDIFAADGEEYFRRLESAAARSAGAGIGQIIAAGGGIVLNGENYPALKQNGLIIWITRPLEELSTKGRPLSENSAALFKMYEERYSLYKKWADCAIDSSTLLSMLK